MMYIRKEMGNSEEIKIIAISCFICGRISPVKKDKYGRWYVKCVGCGMMLFCRGKPSMEWLKNRFTEVKLGEVIW
jgi:hypothetical protein